MTHSRTLLIGLALFVAIAVTATTRLGFFSSLVSLFGVEHIATTWSSLFEAASVHAQVGGTPSISSVTGTFINGSIVTINGTDFGVKSPAKPYLWAPFEGGAQPSSLGIITSWSDLRSMGYAAGEGYGGSGGLAATKADTAWTARVDASSFSWNDLNQRMYLFRRIKRNFDVDDSINWKIIRFWAIDPNTSYTSYPNWYVASNCATFVEGMGGPAAYKDYSSCVLSWGSAGVWRTDEFVTKANSSASLSDGIFKQWVDGVLIESLPRAGSDPSGLTGRWKVRGLETNQVFDIVQAYPVHGVMEHITPQSDWRYWADDIYLDTTWARVMLGDQPTLSSSTHREMQIPTAWDSNNITVSLHVGAFANGQTVYLYVVDADGNVNETGHPVTIGALTPTATLTASPESITEGDSTTLTWSSTDATTCTGTNFSTGNATSGTTSVSPSSETTYSIECTGAGGSASSTASVVVSSTTSGNEIIFQSDFDDSPDTHPSEPVPPGWLWWYLENNIYQATYDGVTHWSGEVTAPGRGGSGKSLKLWRASTLFEGYTGGLRTPELSTTAENIYVRWTMRLPSEVSVPTGYYQKLWRLNTTEGEIYLDLLDTLPQNARLELNDYRNGWITLLPSSGMSQLFDDLWHTYEIYLGTTESTVKLWVDGVLKYTNTNYPMTPQSILFMQHFGLGNRGAGNDHQDSWQAWEFDDLVIANYYVGPPDTTPPAPTLHADFNADNTVNIFDYNLLLTNFGTTGQCGIAGDANGDCAVNIFDYNILLGEFGQSV